MEMRTPSAFSRRSSASPRSKSSISTPSVIFELKPPRGETGFQQNRMDKAHQIAVHELRRRQIDRDLQRYRPRRSLPAGLAQDPFAHLDDQTAFFREGDKIAGRNEAAHWMQPARKRLEADDFAAGDRLARHRLRLIMQRESRRS